MTCEYCQGDYANPFKYDYMPLWFAWRPVTTNSGIAFMRKVHKHKNVGTSSNFAGTYPVIWNDYYEHKES